MPQLASEVPKVPPNMAPRIKLTYPYSDKWEYETFLEKINLEEERIKDLKTGKGFIIETSRNIKLDVKNQTGIFSSRYGSTVTDPDSFSSKYRCDCGYSRSSIMHGERCPICKTMVRFRDDDVSLFGYLLLKGDKYVIHPNMYRVLEGLIGETKLLAILNPIITVNSDGAIISEGDPGTKKDDQFRGIGMTAFRRRFDEIIDYFGSRYPAKLPLYKELKERKDMIFIQSIPVFSALLRPAVLEGTSTLRYQDVNDSLMMLSKLVQEINRDKLGIDRKKKEKESLLYDAQICINNTYTEIVNMLSRKKGDLRQAVSGRYAFTSRSVIRQDPSLRPNHIKLPLQGLAELLQQVIINVLVKSNNISYSEAYKKWYRGFVRGYDETIHHIIDGLIKDSGGLPILINRNPTIQYGSILFVRCIGINMDYTMSISLSNLKLLAADFDGDSLNIMYLTNKQFIEVAESIFDPRMMFISRNDGLCNSDLLPSRDILINANSLKSLGRYNEEEISAIERCMQMA